MKTMTTFLRATVLSFVLAGAATLSAAESALPPAPAGRALRVTSTPPDAAFEILDSDNVQVVSGRTPAIVREPPAKASCIIFRRAGLPPLRFPLEPGAADATADFALLNQWHDLELEGQAAIRKIGEMRQLAEVVGPAVLKDIGALALEHKNAELIAMLGKHGITVQPAKQDPDSKSSPAPPAPSAPTAPPAVAPEAAVATPQASVAAPAFDPIDWNAAAIKEWENTIAQLRAKVESTRTGVRQAEALEAEYQKIFSELLDLAETNADAKAIVARWKVQRTTPPGKPQ